MTINSILLFNIFYNKDKLSFSDAHTYHYCVIPSQCAHWRGNPFSCGAKHRAAFGGRGCGLPHQPADWFAMTPAGGAMGAPPVADKAT